MFNYFKTNTVDSIVSGLTNTVLKLQQVQQNHLEAAFTAGQEIEESMRIRDENIAEAARAEKITNNVKKLLDIS